jgi:hypothetical protein
MFNWRRIEKRLPDTDRQVLALIGSSVCLASFKDGEWWVGYNMRLGGVRRWMEIPGEPKDLEFWTKCLREWWNRRKANVETASDWLSGWGSRNAQLSKKIVYFQNEKTGEIRMGLPENFPASKGFQKVICGSAHEAEVWSDRLRQYNCSKERIKDEERAQIEGEQAKAIRSNIHHLMANSRSKYGKVFMERHLERMDKAESRRRMTREEYLHSEGYERGH